MEDHMSAWSNAKKGIFPEGEAAQYASVNLYILAAIMQLVTEVKSLHKTVKNMIPNCDKRGE